MDASNPPGGGVDRPVRAGDVVSHYRIVAEIGRGGMGVVYRARDVRLDREVALKCPRPDARLDAKLVQRFLNEARAASRLSHPNVVQVYEVFESDGTPWLASELIEGVDLRSAIRARGGLPLEEILQHAEGLSEALAFAHEKGILHRDIKPNNVLIGKDGRAKLADFGLARVFAAADSASRQSTLTEALTGEGHVVGTPGYMSPEQALGRPIDVRSDIFCLGTVLYEMCTGRPAFTASADGDWIDALLHRDPQPISALNHAIPEELARIVRKAIAKRPDERYQHATEMQADVRVVRRRVESGSSSLDPFSEPRPRRLAVPRRVLLLAAGIVALVAVVALVLIRSIPTGAGDHPRVPDARPRQLTGSAGWERDPRLSPDGSLVAFASNAAGNSDVWIMDTRGGSPLQLTDDPADDGQPVWFPDGSVLAFASNRGGKSSIWKVPRLGGPPVLIVPDAAFPAISPDGRRIAFSRNDADGVLRIHVAPLDDVSRARALTREGDGLWYQARPSWSPDGRTICYEDFRDLWLVPSDGGSARKLTTDHQYSTDCAWSPDGKTIYFSSKREGTNALWRMPAAGGAPVRLTIGTGPEVEPSVSRDGSRLAYSTFEDTVEIALFDLRSGQETRLGGFRSADSPTFAPDGSSVVFSSQREGKSDLWLQPLTRDRPGGPPRRITDHPGTAATPAFSPDGKWIAYFRVLEGQRDIWVVPVLGGPPTQFTDDPGVDIHPAWSPDGTRIAYSSDRGGRAAIWVVPVAGGRRAGPPHVLSAGDTGEDTDPDWSPDGRLVAFLHEEPAGEDVWVAPADSSGPRRRLTFGAQASLVRWERTGVSLLVSGLWGEGRLQIRRVRVEDGRVALVEPSPSFGDAATVGAFAISPDGSLLALDREALHGDLWVLEAPAGSY